MKKVFLDTNVILDFILERDGADDAADIFTLGEEKKAELCVSFLTMANTAYVVRRGHTKEELYAFMTDLSAMVRTLSMTENQLTEALQCVETDFEDVLQYVCAKDNDCDVIVTRNARHFRFSDLIVLTPKEFLSQLQAN